MTQADRFNEGKPEYTLIHYPSLEPMVRVLEYGCRKYARDNWKKGLPAKSIIDSLLRHVIRLTEGERTDAESGLQHVGHILCNAMFLSYVLNFKPEFDDLPNEVEATDLSDEELARFAGNLS